MKIVSALCALYVCAASCCPGATPCRAVDLKTEYAVNPIGLDTPKPRFFWKIADSRRGAFQSAYRVVVSDGASSQTLWDSGRVETSASTHIEYAGTPLESNHRYTWRLQVWDKEGKECIPSVAAAWETGFLKPDDWKAQWIGAPFKQVANTEDFTKGVSWIWFPGENAATSAPACTRLFRTQFDAENPAQISEASLWALADNNAVILLNGHEVGRFAGWQSIQPVTVSPDKFEATNQLAVSITNKNLGPAGLAIALTMKYQDGSQKRIVTDGSGWRTSNDVPEMGWKTWAEAPDGWSTSTRLLETWKPAEVLGAVGMKPWGNPNVAHEGDPASLMRKEFAVEKPIDRARLFVTALGAYEMSINGKRVGKDILAPGWTDYRKRALYQTYDVTQMLKPGNNALGAMLGDGWYSSGLGWALQRNCFGDPPSRLKAQLEITYKDGTTATVVSDSSWKCSVSPVQRSEIYAGETYDARLEQAGWDKAGFDASKWENVLLPETTTSIKLAASSAPQIQVTQELKPVSIKSPQRGTYIFDMGQNMVGWARLRVKGKAGDKVRLRFAESLTTDGLLYRENLRRAEATDIYILSGKGQEVFEPHFTYHGFRFVEVTGYPGTPDKTAITGCVFHTAAPFSGEFKTADALANRIWLNALWGQRGNLMSVPTDCPQRDERLGWMGDAQSFWRTACYNMDMAAMTAKWTDDILDAQSNEGAFSDVSPRVIDLADGAPAWGDAGIIVPYTAWLQYGDTRLIEHAWDGMTRWMKYIRAENPDYLWLKRRNNDFGDWVAAGSTTDKYLIATAYWAYDAQLMEQMARALGKSAEAAEYADLFAHIKSAFRPKFVHDDGTIGNGSQTCYVLALHMNLIKDDLDAIAVERLIDDINVHEEHLSTGFLGSTYLLPVLSENGHHYLSCKLLLKEDYPSWGYMIRKGATTIWELWNGDTGNPKMNSQNHFCFGAVSEWMYRYVAGIDVVPGSVGYKQIKIRPRPWDANLNGKAHYDSINGRIAVEWDWSEEDGFRLNVVIPANTTAQVYVPGLLREAVLESGRPIDKAEGIQFVEIKDGCVILNVRAGSYKFSSKP